MQLGDWTLYPLCDGYVDIPQTVLFDQDEATIEKELGSRETTYRTPIFAFLIHTGQQWILVDTGAGTQLGPTAGQLMEKLAAIGCDATDISHILITHLHVDHIGGLLNAQGERAFPNATLYLPQADIDFWTDPDEEAKANDILRPNFPASRQIIATYEDQLQSIGPNQTLLPGIQSLPAFGHTIGHLAYHLSSQNRSALLWGDLVHNAGLQFIHPDWKVTVDTDPEQAVQSRQRLFAEAADQQLLVGGGHVPHPGFGHVSRQNTHYAWTPLPN